MSTTAGDQINRALRLLGVLAEGEAPSAASSQDALLALNQMIDSWSTERLSVFATQTQVFTWPSGQVKRTLGPTGDFVGARPVLIDPSSYFVAPNGVSYPIRLINQDQYNGIAVKTVDSSYPQVMFVSNTMPDTELFVYPVPTQALEWHLVSVQELTQAAVLATELYFPPGYMRAFTYNLACEIAPEFGVEPSRQVQRIAMTSKRNIKRVNNPDYVMSMPYNIMATRGRFNVYTGGF